MMKKYSWIAALVLALSLAFMGCPESGGGGGGGNNPPPPSGNADPIDVTFTQDMLDVWGGGDIVAEGDGTGFTFTYGTGNNNSHGNAVAMFKVDLGGATVRDYEKVTFTFTGIGGDLGPSTGQYDKNTEKGVNLLAAADKDNLKGFGGNDAGLVTYIVNAYTATGSAGGDTINAAGAKIGTDQPKEVDLELAIAPTRPQAGNTGEVWFSIYLHASAVKYDGNSAAVPEEKTSFKITNVSFVPLASALGDITVDVAVIPGVTPPVTGATPVTAITDTDQFTGTVAWADEDGSAVSGTFEDGAVYTATITLAPKEGFTFTGVAENFFTVAGTSTPATNPANSGVVTAVFPAAIVQATALTITVDGVEQAVTLTGIGGDVEYGLDGSSYTFSKTAGYEGSYVYFKVDFGADATLVDFEKVTFTYTGISGDKGYKNPRLVAKDSAFSGNITIAADGANGVAVSDNPQTSGGAAGNNVTLTITPATAETFTGREVYLSIYVGTAASSSNTSNNNTVGDTVIKFSDIEFILRQPDVAVTDTTIGGLTPTAGLAPITTLDMSEYTGTIVWSPTVTGTFATSTAYTAAITLNAKYGYTFDGVAANAFTVTGATSATSDAGSGKTLTITAPFPATSGTAVVLTPIVVDFTTANLTAIGGTLVEDSATATSYTFKGGYPGTVKFEVGLPEGVSLAGYATISFKLTGETTYKTFYVVGGKPLTTFAQTPTNNVCTGSASIGSAGVTDQLCELTIDVTELTLGLTGTIELAVAVWDSSTEYTISDFTISPAE
jgi:hypothetical protein